MGTQRLLVIRTWLEIELFLKIYGCVVSMEYSPLISLLHTTDEYILPETLADYVNVPQFFQLPTSPPRSGTGIYSPLATSMMEERKWDKLPYVCGQG